MWSPTHPALFACVDGVGHLDLWNLNNDTEVSQYTQIINSTPDLDIFYICCLNDVLMLCPRFPVLVSQ